MYVWDLFQDIAWKLKVSQNEDLKGLQLVYYL